MLTASPKGLVTALPGEGDTTVLASSPIDAARVRTASEFPGPVLWFSGAKNGWRNQHRRALPELTGLKKVIRRKTNRGAHNPVEAPSTW